MPWNSRDVERAADGLADLAAKLASVGLVVMTLVISWQVVGRYALNDSPSWSEPIALIAMVYVVLLAAAVGVYEGFHLGLRLFVSMLPIQWKRAAFVVGQLLVSAFGAAMAWNGMHLIDYTSSHVIPTLGISRSVAYWPFVMCGGLIAAFALVRCVVKVWGKGATDPWN